MEIKIFYSWQSDLPNRTNRGFIETALKRAVKKIRNDDSISVEPVIDRDTSGVPGAPNIAETILAKIDDCHVFVGDVSIINHRSEKRKTPNPNVLIELGYALKKLNFSRMIMVLNKAYGKAETLPFDLKMKRVLDYYAPEDKEDLSDEKNSLSKKMENQLRIMTSEIEQIGDANEAKVPCPLEIDFDHKTTRSSQERHDYQLQIRLLNKGSSIIKDYHVDIQFPTRFLSKAKAGRQIEGRSDTDTLFTRVIGGELKGSYPGDSEVIADFEYYVDSINFKEVFSHDKIVRATLYVAGFNPVSVEKSFRSLQNY